MQPLVISQSFITPFQILLNTSFSFAGNIIEERTGFYLTLASTDGVTIQTEAAPLPGISQETIRKTRHDLEEIQTHLKYLEIPSQKDELIDFLIRNPLISTLCPSAMFAVESAVLSLAAKSQNLSLIEFLEGKLEDVSSAALLQGSYELIMDEAREFTEEGTKVFKLKVGDRNIPLDVKKVKDLRTIIGQNGILRLDGNRVWSLKEALLFVELIGLDNIDFIEEPLSDVRKFDEFYQQTHMPIALDETLAVLRCGVDAPGRCSPTLAQQEGVKAFVLKPMLLGLLGTLQWIEEARRLGKKAIISSSFESAVGLKILANLSLLTDQIPGLGTDRWLNSQHLVNEQGIIPKELLK